MRETSPPFTTNSSRVGLRVIFRTVSANLLARQTTALSKQPAPSALSSLRRALETSLKYRLSVRKHRQAERYHLRQGSRRIALLPELVVRHRYLPVYRPRQPARRMTRWGPVPTPPAPV